VTDGVEELQQKLAEWRYWMDGDDPHCIMRQLSTMLWNDAVFRVINECRGLAPQDADGEPRVNGMVHGLINRCHFETQALAIRRLTERNSQRREDKYVISLRRLLDDMGANVGLLTRGNFFEAEALVYDYEPLEQEYYKQRTASPTGGDLCLARQISHNDWLWAARRHEAFDCLSRKDSTHRSRSDAVDATIFAALRHQLAPCDDVKTFVDKFVAHAADPANRDRVPEKERQICLGKIWDCHAVLCRVTTFVSVVLLRGNDFPGLAHPLFDQFQHMDEPLVATRELGLLELAWQEHEREINGWAAIDWPPVWPSRDAT